MEKEIPLAVFREIAPAKVEVLLEDGVVELKLCQVEEKPAPQGYESFSLLLKGPLADFLPQYTYLIRHERWGETPLFMVPIGQEADEITYQIVFNRQAVTSGGIENYG